MHSVEIPEANIKRTIPEHLGECDNEQYVNMCELLYKESIGKISSEVLKVQAIYHLMGMHPSGVENSETDETKYTNLVLLSDLIDSFFEPGENEGQQVIKQYYIHNPIETIIATKGITYYGPSNEFNNVKFGEYVDAISPFEDYKATKDSVFLYQLLATFYREKKPFSNRIKNYSNDKRVVYNAERVQVLIEVFKFQPKGVVYGMYLLFASFQKYLATAKIYIEGKEIDLSILFSESEITTKSDIPGLGMKSTMYSIAESGVFGPLKEVREAPLWEILVRIYDIKKRDLDFISQQKKESNVSS